MCIWSLLKAVTVDMGVKLLPGLAAVDAAAAAVLSFMSPCDNDGDELAKVSAGMFWNGCPVPCCPSLP
jgi:hypothetical protein